jgi:hypothetical protein
VPPEWADCSCCWPQKPFIRKAVGWVILGSPQRGTEDEEIPPFWYLDIGGWPKGHYDTWGDALKAAGRYLESET